MELLWILPMILLLGVQIGLTMGWANLSRKKATATILAITGGIILINYLASGYVTQIQGFIQNYSPVLGIILATLLLYTGFHTLKDWKTKTTPNSIKIAISIVIITSPILVTSAVVMGNYATLVLIMVVTLAYLGLGVMNRALNLSPQVLVGNFMLLAGFYFLTSALVIPNISTISSQQMRPLNIPDLGMFVYALLIVVMLLAAGYYLTRRRSPLLNQKSSIKISKKNI